MSVKPIIGNTSQPLTTDHKPNNTGQKKSRFSRFFQTVSNFFKKGPFPDKTITSTKNPPSNGTQTQKQMSVLVNSNQSIDITISGASGTQKKDGDSGAEKTNERGQQKQSEKHTETILDWLEINTDIINTFAYDLHDLTDQVGKIANHVADIGTATLSTINGVSLITKGFKRFKQAHIINDYWGKVHSGFDLTCGTLQSLSGATKIVSKSLSIVAEKTAKATNAVAISRLQNFGKKAGIVRLVLLSAKTILNMHHSISFAKGLKKAVGTLENKDGFSKEQLKSGLDYLFSQLEISTEELKEAKEKYADNPQPPDADNAEIIKEQKALLNEQEIKACQGKSNDSWNCALAKELVNLKKQKQAQFIRATGKETFDKVNELLKERNEAGQKEWFSSLDEEKVKELLNEVGTSTKDILLKQKGSIGKLAMYAAGITLLILSTVGTGGVLGMVTLVGSILITLIYFIQNLQELRELYKEGQLTAQDKLLLGLTVGLLTISVTLDIIFPGGTGTLGCSGIREGIWIIVYAYSYMRNSRNKDEEEKQENTPLESIKTVPVTKKPSIVGPWINPGEGPSSTNEAKTQVNLL